MINAVSFKLSSNTGRLYENLAFIHILRSGGEVYYWNNPRGLEVDFVIKEGLAPVRLIQVCSDISEHDTKEREVNGLVAGMEYFGLEEGTIVTADLFDEEKVNGRKIRYVPLWYWVLEDFSGPLLI